MSIDDIKSKLVKRSMHYWEKQMKEVAIYKQGKLRTYYTFKSTFKKNISKSDQKFTCAHYVVSVF